MLLIFLLVGVLISGLKAQLRDARRSEGRVRRLWEANLIGVFFADPDGNVRWGNAEFLRLAGRTPAELDAGARSGSTGGTAGGGSRPPTPTGAGPVRAVQLAGTPGPGRRSGGNIYTVKIGWAGYARQADRARPIWTDGQSP